MNDLSPFHIMKEHSLSYRVKTIFEIAIPAIIQCIFLMFQYLISISIGGYLGDKYIIAAIGIGNMYVNVFITAVITGLNLTLTTFVSQSYG